MQYIVLLFCAPGVRLQSVKSVKSVSMSSKLTGNPTTKLSGRRTNYLLVTAYCYSTYCYIYIHIHMVTYRLYLSSILCRTSVRVYESEKY